MIKSRKIVVANKDTDKDSTKTNNKELDEKFVPDQDRDKTDNGIVTEESPPEIPVTLIKNLSTVAAINDRKVESTVKKALLAIRKVDNPTMDDLLVELPWKHSDVLLTINHILDRPKIIKQLKQSGIHDVVEELREHQAELQRILGVKKR